MPFGFLTLNSRVPEILRLHYGDIWMFRVRDPDSHTWKRPYASLRPAEHVPRGTPG